MDFNEFDKENYKNSKKSINTARRLFDLELITLGEYDAILATAFMVQIKIENQYAEYEREAKRQSEAL